MKYKILISDNSFIIADENYILPLCFMLMKKPISIKDYLSNIHKYSKYYMVDLINGEWIRRTFTIEETDSNLPMNMRLKYSKDIQVGDLIEGPDGNPRVVNELHTGEDDMYEIEVAGETYTVNGGHILALVDKDTGEHLEMPVNIFMYMDDEFKSHWVMEKI